MTYRYNNSKKIVTFIINPKLPETPFKLLAIAFAFTFTAARQDIRTAGFYAFKSLNFKDELYNGYL
ncbi:MAG: hypothetical protein LBP59_19035 [Planctomycetaceae bacterium]|nr:hypothetical protein [Planctomycetaceae bacterium]